MFRIILPHDNIEKAINDHSALLANTTFTRMSYKGSKRVVAIYDKAFTGEYAPAVDHPNVSGAKIQVAKSLDDIQAALDKLHTHEVAITVKLASGVKIQIKPYQAEPARILFSTGTIGAPSTVYGRRALEYTEMYSELSQRTDGATYDLSEWLDLVTLALSASYPSLPLVFWDAAGVISTADLERILVATVGCDGSFFDADVPPSDTPA